MVSVSIPLLLLRKDEFFYCYTAQGYGGRGGDRRSRRETAVDESRKETADRVARYQAD